MTPPPSVRDYCTAPRTWRQGAARLRARRYLDTRSAGRDTGAAHLAPRRTAMITLKGIDHIVLPVADVDRALAFYHGVLGLAVEREAEFRAGQIGFPSVRLDARFVIDLVPRRGEAPPGRNLEHFCLVTEAEDLSAVAAALARQGVPVLRGPVERWGAQGMAMSIYVQDPDGNEVEIRTYAPAARAEAERRLAS